ncbi:MAG: DUF4234 domain-containing protein [Firmicutes bacterium]|nr:DUF4234 domain-containing protein [Bacillota bacterium]MBQ9016536.1 DUF4234 domain-containing protein [Bacillota bacterium]
MYDASYTVRERNVLRGIVFSFLTFMVYSYYWVYQLQKDTNRLMGLRSEPSPAFVVVMSILTLGVYQVYWAYRQGVKFRTEAQARGSNEADDCPMLYLVLQLFNYLIGVTTIVNTALMQDRLNQLLRMRGQGRRAYDPDRFNHSPEGEITRRAKERAAAYEAEIANDQLLQDGITGKRSTHFLPEDTDET